MKTTLNDLANGINKGYRIGEAFFREAMDTKEIPQEVPLWFGTQLIGHIWREVKPENRCRARVVAFWRSNGWRGDIGEVVEIRRSCLDNFSESLKDSYILQTPQGNLKIAIPSDPQVYLKVRFPDGQVYEMRLSDFELLPQTEKDD